MGRVLEDPGKLLFRMWGAQCSRKRGGSKKWFKRRGLPRAGPWGRGQGLNPEGRGSDERRRGELREMQQLASGLRLRLRLQLRLRLHGRLAWWSCVFGEGGGASEAHRHRGTRPVSGWGLRGGGPRDLSQALHLSSESVVPPSGLPQAQAGPEPHLRAVHLESLDELGGSGVSLTWAWALEPRVSRTHL